MPVASFLNNGCSEGSVVKRKRFSLVPVLDRSAPTLMAIIQDRIHPGSTIISDSWHTYNGLRDAGFEHQRVNHRYHFIFRSLPVFNWIFGLDIISWIQKPERTPKELREPGKQWNGEIRNIVAPTGSFWSPTWSSLCGVASSATRMPSTKFSRISPLSALPILICDWFLFNYYEKIKKFRPLRRKKSEI